MMATIIQVDEYGNAYFDATDFNMIDFSLGDALSMRIGEKKSRFHSIVGLTVR